MLRKEKLQAVQTRLSILPAMSPGSFLPSSGEGFGLGQLKVQRASKNLFRTSPEIDADAIQPDVQTENNGLRVKIVLLPLLRAFLENARRERGVLHRIDSVALFDSVGADQNQSGGVNGWEEPSRLPQGER